MCLSAYLRSNSAFKMAKYKVCKKYMSVIDYYQPSKLLSTYAINNLKCIACL